MIPGYMCSGVAVVQRGIIYAVGDRDRKNPRKWKLQSFDGTSW